MNPSPAKKLGLLSIVTVVVVAASITFGILHTDDFDARVQFSLTDHTGADVSERDLRGQYLLAFFGFTHCPDVCPTQMYKLTQVMSELDRLGLDVRLTPVFITVDPARDSVERVNAYVQKFHERFIGLTGSQSAVDSAARSFKAYAAIQRGASPDAITHSGVTYIVDEAGRLVGHIPASAPQRDAIQIIKETVL